ncbi:PI-PLC X domain-containing protein 1 [Vanrija pseudolonga]|uniref:PI-PLC X domain-containing protein 1 n=1 Tax=Vanrija pseudolonga TaxID=143232 RepID=A0AAF0YCD2_9TREE|nr:PI-PLC X domain-containing protein 1 [Vanrija pseudolonga]
MRFSIALALAPLLALPALAASVCNGDASLCTRLYSNVTYIGAHDSYAVGQSITDNQDKDVTAQLNDGIRALQIQTHNTSSGIHLCHTSCALLDAGLLSDYLTKVKTWLDANPNEVVTLVLVNIDNLPATAFASAFQTAGLDKKSFVPKAASNTISDWPTLGSLIDAGTNLVTFLNYNADFTAVPYLIDEFTNMWEDAYNVVDQEWGCAVNRSSNTGPSPNQKMYMINHFLDKTWNILGNVAFIPDKDKLNETNAATGPGSIGFHVNNCVLLYQRNPNIILLDYYDSNGNAPFVAAAQLNGVAAPTNSITPGSISATGSAGASGTGPASPSMSVSSNKPGAAMGATPAGLGLVVAIVGVAISAVLV